MAYGIHGCQVQTQWPKVRPPTKFSRRFAARSGVQLPSFAQILDSQVEEFQLRGIESWRTSLCIHSLDPAYGSITQHSGNHFLLILLFYQLMPRPRCYAAGGRIPPALVVDPGIQRR